MPQLYIITREDSMDPELLARHRKEATSQGRELRIESANATPNNGVTFEEILRNPAVAGWDPDAA